ncbi:MAG: hypothetical protein FJZ11_04040 [Candidatus Omnitrophica bacterium]|nr:hypothetical protein [Candidatus Omnitrophota bacterium]
MEAITNLREKAKEIVNKYNKFAELNITNRPVYSNQISEIGNPCDRYLFYNRTNWQSKKRPESILGLIFREGRLHERDIKATLLQIGYETKKAEIELVDNEGLNITGHIDSMIEIDGKEYPIEFKSLSQNTWNETDTITDMLEHKYYYVRKYPIQLIFYVYLSGADAGFFLLKNKVTGEWKTIVMELAEYKGLVDITKERIKKINQSVINDEPPSVYEGFDEWICVSCPYNHICEKGLIYEKEIKESINLSNDDIVRLAKILLENKDSYEQYKKTDELLSKIIKGNGEGSYIINDLVQFRVTRRVKESYEVKGGEYLVINKKWLKS